MLTDPISWYFSLDKTQTIEFWVAFGTIALALATVFAVLIGLRQNTQENRRFEQGFAPLLEVQAFDVQGSLFYIINVANNGYGPALDVSLKMSGTRLKKTYNPDSTVKTNFTSERLTLSIEKATSIIVNGSQWSFYTPQYEKNQEAIEKEGLDVVVVLAYEDRFGNEYRTQYTDFPSRQYKWIPPKRLRPRTFGVRRK